LAAIQNRFDARNIFFIGTNRDERVASADAFFIYLGLFPAHPGSGQGTDQSTGNRTGTGSCQRRGEPASGNQWANARDGHEPKTGQYSNDTPNRGTNPSSSSGGRMRFRVRRLDVAPTGILVRHQTDLPVRLEIGRFQVAHY
jgi:hypothetical protein